MTRSHCESCLLDFLYLITVVHNRNLVTFRDQGFCQIEADESMTAALAVYDKSIISSDLDREAPVHRGI